MKRFTALTVLLAAIAAYGFAEYPPEGWTADIIEAIEQAEREDKMLLLNFTGSDWCGWCHKLEGEVFGTQEFETWAEDNLVRVFLDFPRGIDLSDETRQQNAVLQQMLGVAGYPTVWLLGSDLTPLLKTGYQDGGPASYIAHLERDQINLEPAEAENFRRGFRQGIEEYIGPIG